MGRRTTAITVFGTVLLCFLFFCPPVHGETNYTLIKGEIAGINAKTIQFETQESLSVGDKLTLVRGGETVAVCEVVKIKESAVTAEILEQTMEPDFDDTVMLVVEVKPPAEEKPKETIPEVKPEETTPPETQTPQKETPAEVKSEVKKEETVTPVTPEAKKETPPVTPEETKETAINPAEPDSAQDSTKISHGKTLSFSLGYSAFGPQGIEFSKSGYLGEIDYKIKSIPGLFVSLQYAQHKWSGASTDLSMSQISANVSYPVQKLPLSIANIIEPYVTLGASSFRGTLTQNGAATSSSFSGLNYGFSLLIKRLVKLDYKFHSFSATFGALKISGGEQLSFSVAPLKF